jgi:hypothetical protein
MMHDKKTHKKKYAYSIAVMLILAAMNLFRFSFRGNNTKRNHDGGAYNGTWPVSTLRTPSQAEDKSTNLLSSVRIEKLGALAPSSVRLTHFSCNTNHKTCVTPELVGQWQYEEFRNFTNNHCCDPNHEYPGDRHFCQDRNSSSLRHPSVFEGSNTGLAWMLGNGCEKKCRRTFRDKYVWKSPNLPQWNPTEFCQLLGPYRRIIMIGDSTMSQAGATLMNAVHGWCQTQLVYFIVDTLINEEFGVLNRGSHWLEIARNHSITRDGDIVVLTVGAHIVNMIDLYNVSDLVLQQITAMKVERPNLTILYKTQQPGGCTHTIANLSLSPLQAGETFDFGSGYHFNHPLLYEYDKRVICHLQALGIPFLDMRMLFSRSDAHPSSKRPRRPKDCLHFCSPGPLDIFAILFLRLLQNNFAVSPCMFEY